MKHQRLVQTTAVAAFAPVGAAALAFNSRSKLNGGANRDRTDDLKLAKLALSQLSYGPVVVHRLKRSLEASRPSGRWRAGRSAFIARRKPRE